MKGGWELQCFRCAVYMKGPLIFDYQERQHGKYGFLQSRFALLFVLLFVMTLNVIQSYTKELLQFHFMLFKFHKVAVTYSKIERWWRGRPLWGREHFCLSWTTDHIPSPLNAQAIPSCFSTVIWECKLKWNDWNTNQRSKIRANSPHVEGHCVTHWNNF